MSPRKKFQRPLELKRGAVLATCAAVFTLARAAPEEKLECPQSIEQKSVQLTNTPAGWTSFVHRPLYLHGAELMSGPPEELGELADFSQRHERGAWIYTYQLDYPFPAGKWLVCTYGEGDQVTLGKRLDDSVKVCAFTHRKGDHVGENKITISCR